MYWHPFYVKARTGMVKALAAFLAGNTGEDSLIGIRQNFNAIGNEQLGVPEEAQNSAGWNLLAGARPAPRGRRRRQRIIAKW
jgi:hypothetical protein